MVACVKHVKFSTVLHCILVWELHRSEHDIRFGKYRIQNDVQIKEVESPLKDEVEMTISKLKKAGIVVWMLTGDKKETAVNLAHASGKCCDIIHHYNQIMVLIDKLSAT